MNSAGNIYIADCWHNRIRKVDHVTGIITTIAGTGAFGDNGDGGQASAAEVSLPAGLALDASGDLYFTENSCDVLTAEGIETCGARIRKIDLATGIITTIAGNGTYGYNGNGGPATDAAMAQPTGIALDSEGDLSLPTGTTSASVR